MTATLSTVTEPHEVRDATKLAGLIAAYESDLAVTPIVVLVGGNGSFALCGSHRIAALREVYEGDASLEDDLASYVLVEDFERVYVAADDDLRGELDRLVEGRGLEFDSLVERIRPLLGREAQAALEDQIA